jgi:hypothetical protein
MQHGNPQLPKAARPHSGVFLALTGNYTSLPANTLVVKTLLLRQVTNLRFPCHATIFKLIRSEQNHAELCQLLSVP